MSQSTYTIAANKSGTQYRSEDNDGKQALASSHKGSAAPSYALAGLVWIDDSANPLWTVKVYDGTDWITQGTINVTTNVWKSANACSIDGSTNYAADAGANDTYAITNTSIPTPIAGMVVRVKFNTANTGAATLAVNGGANVAIKKNLDVALNDNDIKANAVHNLLYDGTNWVLLSPVSDIYFVFNQTSKATPTTSDLVLIADAAASNVTKSATISSLSSLFSGGYSGYAAKTANYTVLAADKGYMIDCTSNSFTLTLTAAATLTATHFFYVKNSGTGIITIDPNGAELINGAATITVYPGECFMVTCTATAFITVGRQLGWVHLSSATTAGASSIDFTTYINTDFKMYKWMGYGIQAATSGATFGARHSVATVFDTGANYNQAQYSAWNSSSGQRGGTGGTVFEIIRSLENTANQTAVFEYTLTNPGDTAARKRFQSFAGGETTSSGTGSEIEISGGEYEASNSAIDGTRFLMSSGNTVGTIVMSGYRVA